MPNSHHDTLPILVVGAGIAGLACAQALQQAGKNVVVLEARSRIGGRIHSIIENTHTFDLGASWIHGTHHNPIWEIAQKHQIKTAVYHYDQSRFYHEHGVAFTPEEQQECEDYIQKIDNLLTQSQAPSALEAIEQILDTLSYPPGKLSAAELKRLLLQFYERLANDPFATSLSELSTHYQRYEGYFAGDEVIFPEGYAQIIHSLSPSLAIQLGIEICKVIVEEHQVQLIDQHHTVHLGSQVIITVPLGVLKQQIIEFNPPLPALLQKSIQHMGFGSFNKVFLEFERPLALGENSALTNSIFYRYQAQWFNLLDLSAFYAQPTYLMLFGGPQSVWIDQMTDTAMWQRIYSSLSANFPPIPHRPQRMIMSRWGADPYSYGSFSFPAPQHSNAWVEPFLQPLQNRLYFAGEHCSLQYAGTVHGAYLSGQDTAQKIIEQDNEKRGSV